MLDGEVIALREDGRPYPFQVTMSRFGTKGKIEEQRASLPLSSFFFDCVHLDGEDLLDRPARERLANSTGRFPRRFEFRGSRRPISSSHGVPRGRAGPRPRGRHGESLDTPYEAGRRGAGWLKVKPAHTLDLVVLAVEWGSGRRKGKLEHPSRCARSRDGGFVMLGKRSRA